ncbi:nucleotidyltransferase family protein [Litoreibacter halocynthiae]|uniref:nucleotidyltransferase family protein n=1 Tax=Litoreibacter halocynthiae TaxID=1242689 RepID=UPI00249365D7|nr:nucleotidyltransferase family protein [Litoreibacter halocynthiae]
MSIAILLLAGGASSRMGSRDKLMEDVGGIPLVQQRAMVCIASSADQVRAVLPPDKPRRAEALEGLDIDIVYNEGAALGLSHSLRSGLVGIDAEAVLIVLADLPDITTADLDKVIKAAKAHPLATILRGADGNGKAGHPVLIRNALFEDLKQLEGDTGAQPVLRQHKTDTVLVPIGTAALRDLDTPEDWETWRTEQKT